MNQQHELEANADLFRECESIIGYEFRDRTLLERCLTHSSVARTRLDSNERLEFLGDAILGSLVCEMLYNHFPNATEGELTRIKSVLVSRHMCANISQKLGLESVLLLGKGLTTFDSIPQSILAAVVESLVAGLYLDGGLEEARRFVEKVLADEIDKAVDMNTGKNYKSLLQQAAQKRYAETPTYRLLDEKGPDHLKCFLVAAVIGDRSFTGAWGSNKKEAEQQAAKNALLGIEREYALELDGEND